MSIYANIYNWTSLISKFFLFYLSVCKSGASYPILSYRVLLTRFRHGMVIWVPEGDDEDRTRPKKMIDDTYNLLRNFGLKEL